MRLSDILAASRIVVDTTGVQVPDKEQALRVLGALLAPELKVDAEAVHKLLSEREKLQSTGIGEGVAIPHTSIEEAPRQAAALLLCPRGVPFDSIDGNNVHIIFGVVGPKRATSEHLKTLARVSRMLRSPETRRALLESPGAEQAYSFIEEQDAALG
jgi:PTS system nitrogen regulatory IIA component